MAPPLDRDIRDAKTSSSMKERGSIAEISGIFDIKEPQLAGYFFINRRNKEGDSVNQTIGILFTPTETDIIEVNGVSRNAVDIAREMGLAHSTVLMMRYLGHGRYVQPNTLILVHENRGIEVIDILATDGGDKQNTLFNAPKNGRTQKIGNIEINSGHIPLVRRNFDSRNPNTHGCESDRRNDDFRYTFEGTLTPNILNDDESRKEMSLFVRRIVNNDEDYGLS